LTEPGVINHRSPLDILTFGEHDGRQSPRCTALHEALAGAGTTPGISANIIHELWAKFCGQSTLASLTTLTGLDLGPLRDNAHSARLFRDAMHEVERVGRAVVPDLPAGMADRTWAFLQGLSPHLHASMLDDLRRQKPLEHDYLSGEVVRLGQEHGVDTPIHAVFDAALRPVAERLAHGGP
jgi:2-dehydropantoate 2-reductase